jgi:uncharacterized delta-60 repeat protein
MNNLTTMFNEVCSIENTSFYNNLGTGFNRTIFTIAVQPDEKILVGGYFTKFNGNTRNRLIRLNSDGTEDTSFYSNLGSGFNKAVLTLAVQSNGKILVGGFFTEFNGNIRNYLVRLNPDGTEDTSFYNNLENQFNDSIYTIAVQSNEKILIGGNFTELNGNTRNYLVRLNPDGTEDTSFYDNLGIGFNHNISAIAVQNGKILVGGSFTSFNGNTRNYLVRLNSDGTEDTSFYNNLGAGFNSRIYKITVQSNGKILVGGFFTKFNGNTRNGLVRLNSDGTEDTSFCDNLGSGFNNSIYEIAVQSNGKILVVGYFTNLNGNTRKYIVRLNHDGTEDTSFYDSLEIGFNKNANGIFAIAVQNGKILVGGDFIEFNESTRNHFICLWNQTL